MYDIAYFLGVFESLPAYAQHDILVLAAELAAESQRRDPYTCGHFPSPGSSEHSHVGCPPG